MQAAAGGIVSAQLPYDSNYSMESSGNAIRLYTFILGSMASRSPSPMKLKASTVIMISRPG